MLSPANNAARSPCLYTTWSRSTPPPHRHHLHTCSKDAHFRQFNSRYYCKSCFVLRVPPCAGTTVISETHSAPSPWSLKPWGIRERPCSAMSQTPRGSRGSEESLVVVLLWWIWFLSEEQREVICVDCGFLTPDYITERAIQSSRSVLSWLIAQHQHTVPAHPSPGEMARWRTVAWIRDKIWLFWLLLLLLGKLSIMRKTVKYFARCSSGAGLVSSEGWWTNPKSVLVMLRISTQEEAAAIASK